MKRSKVILLGAFACLLLFHILAVMGHLMRDGRLAMVPVYDDVAYLIDAWTRLEVLDRSGMAGFLRDLWVRPAHAPFMAVTGALGMLLAAGSPAGAYLLNAGWIGVFAVLMLLILRQVDLRSRIGVCIAALAVPLFGFAIAEYRPDPVWGVLVGLSSALLVTVNLPYSRRAAVLLLGLLIGVAVIAKPTGAPAATVVIGTTWLAWTAASFVLRRPFHRRWMLRRSLLMVLGSLVVIVPFLLTSGPQVAAYIMAVMDPANSVWRTQASVWGHLAYYLNGGTGRLALGWMWAAALPLIAIALVVLVRARDRIALAAFAGLASGLAMSYLIVTVSAVKSLMIGSILYGMLVATVVWCIGQILRYVPLRHGLVLALGSLMFLANWTPHLGMVMRTDPAMQTTDDANKATLPLVVEALRTGTNRQVLVTVPGPVYSGTLDFLARQQGAIGTFEDGYTWDRWELFTQAIERSGIVIVSEPGLRGQALGFSFPSVAFQPRVLEHLRASGAFEEHRAYRDEAGRSVWVFVRKGG